jgi:uncharacterized membrane protein
MASGQQLARFLGWFSIGLGLVQLAGTGRFARFIGVKDNGIAPMAVRAVGLREIASGLGILASSRPSPWLWARVAGDVKDLALLASALRSEDNRRGRVAAAMVAVVGVAGLDLLSIELAGRRRGTVAGERDGPVSVRKSITVNRPVEEVYAFWRDFQNLPRFMRHLESVEALGPEGRSRWTATAPVGRTVTWEAEVVEDRRNELIEWRSLEGSDVSNSGAVRFSQAPAGRGTQVTVELRYDAPGGPAGVMVARLLAEEPEQQVREDLRLFKQVMETGEVTQSDATVGGTHFLRRPAQPPDRAEAP